VNTVIVGVINGASLVIVFVAVALVRRKFDPGSVLQDYPLKDHLSTPVQVVVAYAVLVSLLGLFIHLPYGVSVLTCSLLVILVAYLPLSFLVSRQQLVDPLYHSGLCLLVGAALARSPLSLALLILGGLLTHYAETHYDKTYVTRYNNWVTNKVTSYQQRFGSTLQAYSPNLQEIMLTILVIEDVARPKYFRFLERMYARLYKTSLVSTGIMQVMHRGPLTDQESVVLGCKLVNETYLQAKASTRQSANSDKLLLEVAKRYNGLDTHQEYLEYMGYFLPIVKKQLSTIS
jgi:hypothetical protein